MVEDMSVVKDGEQWQSRKRLRTMLNVEKIFSASSQYNLHQVKNTFGIPHFFLELALGPCPVSKSE
ncbi:hypothetical protein CCR75_002796 [Bremia lactucae]|uniref:Uncharacterized protein n=1 Tax=Bremia lactucae TaxID=4779 RepID=A0A976FQC7_BRELC|nr:hypothetical protein CCR75_002796 [Bremia lactucae]